MQLVHSLASIDNYGHPAGGSKWTLLAELKLPALGFGGFCLQVAGGVGFPVGTFSVRDINRGDSIHPKPNGQVEPCPRLWWRMSLVKQRWGMMRYGRYLYLCVCCPVIDDGCGICCSCLPWLMIDDWWLMIEYWLLMIDDWWLMIDDVVVVVDDDDDDDDDWRLKIEHWRLMIDDWWLMIDDDYHYYAYDDDIHHCYHYQVTTCYHYLNHYHYHYRYLNRYHYHCHYLYHCHYHYPYPYYHHHYHYHHKYFVIAFYPLQSSWLSPPQDHAGKQAVENDYLALEFRGGPCYKLCGSWLAVSSRLFPGLTQQSYCSNLYQHFQRGTKGICPFFITTQVFTLTFASFCACCHRGD